MYLLDTNACIRILNDTSAAVTARFRRESPATIRLCAVVKAELLFGARKSRDPGRSLQRLHEFFQPLTSLPFDDLCAEHYGMVRAELERLGQPIGSNDLLIAATARAHDLTLVTNNVREFARVVGLRVEDWEVAPIRSE